MRKYTLKVAQKRGDTDVYDTLDVNVYNNEHDWQNAVAKLWSAFASIGNYVKIMDTIQNDEIITWIVINWKW